MLVKMAGDGQQYLGMNTMTDSTCPECGGKLRQQLAGAQAEIEKYRLREWAAYQALGYSPPVSDALPQLIECMMNLKASLQENLERCEKASGWTCDKPVPVWECIERLRHERDAAQKACAEMRRQIGAIKHAVENNQPIPWMTMCERMDHALSSDCGSGYVPRAELDKLKAANKVMVVGIAEALIEWPYCNETLKNALAHAKQLGL